MYSTQIYGRIRLSIDAKLFCLVSHQQYIWVNNFDVAITYVCEQNVFIVLFSEAVNMLFQWKASQAIKHELTKNHNLLHSGVHVFYSTSFLFILDEQDPIDQNAKQNRMVYLCQNASQLKPDYHDQGTPIIPNLASILSGWSPVSLINWKTFALHAQHWHQWFQTDQTRFDKASSAPGLSKPEESGLYEVVCIG